MGNATRAVDTVRSSEKIESLQIVRAVAFLGIFIYHAVHAFPGQGLLYNVFSTGVGPWGVSVFFVLSGFLMVYSYWDRPLERTLKNCFVFSNKKIRKLYPLHLVMLLAGAVYMLLTHSSIPGIIKRLIVTVPLLQTWLPEVYQSVNTVAWYLSVALFSYFVFPYLLPFFKGRKCAAAAVWMIAIFLMQNLIGFSVFRFTNIDIKWIVYCHPVYRLGDFAIGGLLAVVYKKSNIKSSFSKGICSLLEIAAIVISAAACACYPILPESFRWFRYTCFFIPASILFVFAFSLNKGIVSGLLKNRFTNWLAYISPYAFLIHYLVIKYFHSFVEKVFHTDNIHFAVVIIVPFAVTVSLVYCYLFIEKKIQNLSKRK